jgi:penicillin-binding protein 1C
MSRRRWVLGSVAMLLLGLGVFRVVRPPLLDALSFSHAIYDRNHQLLRLTLAADERYRLKLPLSEVGSNIVNATLLLEDRHFRQHFGVNPVSLLRAAKHWIKGDARVGGSTITMQVVRLRWQLQSKTWWGKIKQIALAVWLELHYSKQEILEAYFNLAPYGGNIEGVGAASLIYFHKEPSELNLSEALSLAVIPKNPVDRLPGTLSNERARTKLAALWKKIRGDADEVGHLALKVFPSSALPFRAPHFVQHILTMDSTGGRRITTIDIDKQAILEGEIKSYIESQKSLGVQNAAALLINTSNMRVLGSVGSANFFNDAIQGQVDGTSSPRSPGSILKPFVYALALDQGLIHPLTVLKDTPKNFRGFDPANFDQKFLGPVSATEALIFSRNLPAVDLASRLHDPSFYEFLKSVGVPKLREPEFYGLALVLGGLEISMEDLVKLYAMLANRGVYRPLSFLLSDLSLKGQNMVSPEAAYLTLDMLEKNQRPDEQFSREWVRDPMDVAWKTGTSFGFRDAWAIGVFGPYVLAVWIGNFDGGSNPALVGREMAGPLFFRIIDALRHEEKWESMRMTPAQLTHVKICPVSGKIAGPRCKHAISGWFVPGKSPIQTCDVHRSVLVSKKTGLQACPGDFANSKEEVFEFWPSDILKLFQEGGIPRRTPPPYDPKCELEMKSRKGLDPVITSPRGGVEYLLPLKSLEAEQIPLSATADSDAKQLFWFVDQSFVGKVSVNEPLLWHPRPGQFTIRVVDDQGRSHAQGIQIHIVN